MGIAGKLLEAELILRWLARLAEADLIRRDDAIAGINERGDGGLPGGSAEILPVQQYRDPSGGARRLHVHVSHLECLALGLEAAQRNRPGIVETFQTRAINRAWVGQRGIVGWSRLCCVRFLDVKTRKRFKFLTNNFTLPAFTIAQIYKSRWQVELFFRWIKQRLRIKAFYGTSENAVKTQIWIVVSVYVLVAIVRKRLGLEANYCSRGPMQVILTPKDPQLGTLKRHRKATCNPPKVL